MRGETVDVACALKLLAAATSERDREPPIRVTLATGATVAAAHGRRRTLDVSLRPSYATSNIDPRSGPIPNAH